MAREGTETLFRFDSDDILLSGLGKRSLLGDNAFQRLLFALVTFAFPSIGEEGDFDFGSDCEGES